MRAKPHLSPLFFSNSTYPKLFVLLILLIAVTLVSAAVFVYYPANINANWVNPPVTFFNPGTSGVSVTFYDDNTRADIEVTSPGVLVRTQRKAFIWDDFSTNPFSPPARLTVLGSSCPGARWDPTNQYVVFNATNGGSGDISTCNSTNGDYNLDHMVAYYGTQTDSDVDKVYLLMRTCRLSSSYGLWKGFFLFRSITNPIRYYTYELWDPHQYAPAGGMTIVRVSGNSATRLIEGGTSDGGQWYVHWGVRDRLQPNRGYMEYRIYSGQNFLGQISTGDDTASHRGAPNYVGFGGALDRYEIVAFDDFIACADADPGCVNVTGLQSGWTVTLKDSNGGTVDQKTAGLTGFVSLNVLTKPIIRSASFEITYNGIVILPSQSFSEVVGGDVYECRIRDMNILGFHNYDSKDYNVYVRVENLIPNGYSGSINLWVRVGTVESTPLRIVGSNIQQGTTSPVTLGYDASGYIHGTFSLSPSPSTPVVLTLSFHYYIPSSEVEVEYPITVRIHS